MSEHPKEGIYLDAALGVIGEQVAERINELKRRRRHRQRAGTAILVATTVLSGSVAGYALVQSQRQAVPSPAAASELLRLSCIEGAAATEPAYFTVSYRIDADAAVDATAVCADARATVGADAVRIAQASPTDLVRIATVLMGAGPDAHLQVETASFGVVSAVDGTPEAICEGERSMIVLLRPAGESAPGVYTTCRTVKP